MSYPRAIITGCDEAQYDFIPWWAMNLRKQSTLPTVVGTPTELPPYTSALLGELKIQHTIVPPILPHLKDTFGGRAAKMHLPQMVAADVLLWVDVDCKILRDPDDLFNIFNFTSKDQIALRPDQYGTQEIQARLLPGEQVYNGGVFMTPYRGSIVTRWRDALPMLWGWTPGDQSILARVLHCGGDRDNIMTIPKIWNTMSHEMDPGHQIPPATAFMHYTAPWAKSMIMTEVNAVLRDATLRDDYQRAD